ncbi:hypothetical protein BU14_0212s0017 [Porphyra umbilicalis]|uniref:Uncharacterized protein n=1 Tax=Porphyra umbilicalis TaxID=2786 RepID=A0A1X6P574_PORUM|nr:hypothetical protein BU14_0212s0017 [Porphyra umbilicalis]|eukprot:OSX75997.1 hypothetical protein BU14_0212s0017 [Porphyra umbilicalis]
MEGQRHDGIDLGAGHLGKRRCVEDEEEGAAAGHVDDHAQHRPIVLGRRARAADKHGLGRVAARLGPLHDRRRRCVVARRRADLGERIPIKVGPPRIRRRVRHTIRVGVRARGIGGVDARQLQVLLAPKHGAHRGGGRDLGLFAAASLLRHRRRRRRRRRRVGQRVRHEAGFVKVPRRRRRQLPQRQVLDNRRVGVVAQRQRHVPRRRIVRIDGVEAKLRRPRVRGHWRRGCGGAARGRAAAVQDVKGRRLPRLEVDRVGDAAVPQHPQRAEHGRPRGEHHVAAGEEKRVDVRGRPGEAANLVRRRQAAVGGHAKDVVGRTRRPKFLSKIVRVPRGRARLGVRRREGALERPVGHLVARAVGHREGVGVHLQQHVAVGARIDGRTGGGDGGAGGGGGGGARRPPIRTDAHIDIGAVIDQPRPRAAHARKHPPAGVLAKSGAEGRPPREARLLLRRRLARAVRHGAARAVDGKAVEDAEAVKPVGEAQVIAAARAGDGKRAGAVAEEGAG